LIVISRIEFAVHEIFSDSSSEIIIDEIDEVNEEVIR